MWIIMLAAAAAALLAWLALRFGPAPMGLPSGQGINVLEKVEIGGRLQWISIQGKNADDPVLLFLHGGPGSANLAKLRMQCPALLDRFIVVNWDQRGAGKNGSFSRDAGLTIDRLREDTHELILHLRARFGGKKIYLMGFSWGTALGLMTARDHPEDLEVFISVGQLVNARRQEELSLGFARKAAQEAGNAAAIGELSGIDPAYDSPGWFAALTRERKWLLAFGGVYHTSRSYAHEMRMLLTAPEYSFIDVLRWLAASRASLAVMWPEVMGLDLSRTVPEVGVPVYFLVGRHDYNTPSELTAAYFGALRAPRGKRLIWFEDSAHDIFFDQPDALVKALTDIRTEVESGGR